MSYGSPERPEDILPYYTDIRRGRAPTPEQLADLTARYEAIGGLSNLNEISRSEADGIARVLAERGGPVEYRVYYANRHWQPWIPDVVKQMAKDGIDKAVGLVLSPQGSKMSSGAYFEVVDQTLAGLPDFIEFEQIFAWHLEPDFIEALTAKVAEGLARFPESVRKSLPVVFTAHSLPQRILTWGDPYPTHLREMGAAVAQRLGLENVQFAYQSAGRTPEPWLGPEIRAKVKELAAAGEKHVLVCAAGFISDHLEILYDLDIELKQEAEQLGVHFERTGMLNDHPLLLKALAGAVCRYATGE
jgi:ferrochelatase